MNFINLTPHAIVVLDANDGVLATIPSLGEARCQQMDGEAKSFGAFVVKSRSYGNVTGLPTQEEGTKIIVSQLVAQACPDRSDLVWPGDVKRENGQVVGCYNFCKLP